MDAGRPELKRYLDYLRDGDTLLVTKIDRRARVDIVAKAGGVPPGKASLQISRVPARNALG